MDLDNMKDYTHFHALELAQDNEFIKGVKSPLNEELNKNWAAWLQANPEKKEIVAEAKRIIQAVTDERQYSLAESKKYELWERIDETIIGEEIREPEKRSFRSLPRYGIAAAITLIAVSSLWYFQRRSDFQLADSNIKSSLDESQLLKVSNEGNKTYTLLLSDGSKVTLQPHSTIQYPEVFSER